jgi:hypothetical protein
MAILGPNTAAHTKLLSPRVILCAGEDGRELERAFSPVVAGPSEFFEYRCYRFWRFAEATVVWTGIGTGCLEPLLWEMILPGIVERIVLIGSAGRLPNSRADVGEPRWISEAYSGGTSLDGELADRPVRPRFAVADGETASIVSTDYYYGFTDRSLDASYPAAGAGLRSAVEKFLPVCDLVDMETAQFYHFCERFDRTGRLQYVAIKGAANDIGSQMSQLAESEPLLGKCFRRAWEIISRPLASSNR